MDFAFIETPMELNTFYGTELEGERLVKWSLDGELVLAINIDDEVPSNLQKRRRLLKGVRVNGVAISRDDRIFVTDGYATSLIHEFDQQGNYLTSLGGKKRPLEFLHCTQNYY